MVRAQRARGEGEMGHPVWQIYTCACVYIYICVCTYIYNIYLYVCIVLCRAASVGEGVFSLPHSISISLFFFFFRFLARLYMTRIRVHYVRFLSPFCQRVAARVRPDCGQSPRGRYYDATTPPPPPLPPRVYRWG